MIRLHFLHCMSHDLQFVGVPGPTLLSACRWEPGYVAVRLSNPLGQPRACNPVSALRSAASHCGQGPSVSHRLHGCQAIDYFQTFVGIGIDISLGEDFTLFVQQEPACDFQGPSWGEVLSF